MELGLKWQIADDGRVLFALLLRQSTLEIGQVFKPVLNPLCLHSTRCSSATECNVFRGWQTEAELEVR